MPNSEVGFKRTRSLGSQLPFWQAINAVMRQAQMAGMSSSQLGRRQMLLNSSASPRSPESSCHVLNQQACDWIARRLEAIAVRLEARASRFEARASRLEAIAIRLENHVTEAQLIGHESSKLGFRHSIVMTAAEKRNARKFRSLLPPNNSA